MTLRELEHFFTDLPVRKYSQGQIILYPEDTLKFIYFVKHGYCKMYRKNDQGDDRVYMLFQPKTAFPVLPVGINKKTYLIKFYYQAMTNVEVYQLTREQFSQILEKHKEVSAVVLKYMTELYADLIKRLGIIENKDAKSKIANVFRYLINISGEEVKGGIYKLHIKITHQDIASLAGLTRETASINLKQLEADKVIERKAGRYLIINAYQLPE